MDTEIEKIKYAVKNTTTDKLLILEYLLSTIQSVSIDTITGLVHIKTAKNIVIENDGHLVTINKGMNVQIASQIHLNPNIEFKTNEISTLEETLKTSIKKEEEKLIEKTQELLEEQKRACEGSDDHCH